MKKKPISAKSIKDDVVHQIAQLLHLELDDQRLSLIRDMVVSAGKRKWNKASYLGKALIHHYGKSNMKKNLEEISYHDLLMAELIRNFSIATKAEYLAKCKEFKIYPFMERKVVNKNTVKMSVDEVVEMMKKSLRQSEKQVDHEKLMELRNALSQDYPICSFEHLQTKSRLN